MSALEALKTECDKELVLIGDSQAHAECLAVFLRKNGYKNVNIGTRNGIKESFIGESDMREMVCAQEVVMSNSSFAWWSCKIGDSLFEKYGIDRKVVFPSGWVGPNPDNITGCALGQVEWIWVKSKVGKRIL